MCFYFICLVSAKTGGNVNESMNALVTEIIRKETNIKVIDVSQNVPISDNSNGHDDDDEIIDYDDGEPVPGTSFWAGHGSSGWSAKTAIASNTLPPLDKTKGYKIILLGAAVTAKTSFLKRYVYDTFNPEYLATIGVDFAIRKESCLGEEIKLMLWDTAGQERYEAITNSYLKGCIGMILTYDITDRRSIETIRRKYMTYWKDYPYITIMVIGSKLDLRDFREVPTEDGESLARDLHASLFFEGKNSQTRPPE